jgi:hypothetical protein
MLLLRDTDKGDNMAKRFDINKLCGQCQEPAFQRADGTFSDACEDCRENRAYHHAAGDDDHPDGTVWDCPMCEDGIEAGLGLMTQSDIDKLQGGGAAQ